MLQGTDQIYSATYSNVPVFEFVTSEGPIMRRKADGWINATHILKIAKFPKAKRTRILEKDVQSGVHEKVQGGYGKYQGTYVPLELGAEIARLFGVYQTLEPIFKFQYIEGKSETPPPAPKHNHASASNVGRRQQPLKVLNADPHQLSANTLKKRTNPEHEVPESLRKRGRPKRVPLQKRHRPELSTHKTMPTVSQTGPSMGTFTSKQDSTLSRNSVGFPSLTRQDTEKDALQIMASNLSVRNDDLELDTSGDEGNYKLRHNQKFATKDDDEEFLSGRELFGFQDSFNGGESFDRLVEMHRRNRLEIQSSSSRSTVHNGANNSYSGFMHYQDSGNFPPSRIGDYFTILLEYFLHDDKSGSGGSKALPHEILNPPEPLSNVNINQRVDNDGNSILHWICAMANLTLVEFLISKFNELIDLNLKNYHGESPLMFLVKFNNSYQQQNFQDILQLLKGSISMVDNKGQTVLHHIAYFCKLNDPESRSVKERYAKYYLDCILEAASEIDSQSGSAQEMRLQDLLNYQDSEGNTALHVFAYNMSKKCIKSIIKYHEILNLGLRNAVNHTAEDYLASNNYILRIENDYSEEIKVKDAISIESTAKEQASILTNSQGLESQLHNSKEAISLQNRSVNAITEKLSELSYAMHRELSSKDEKLLTLLNCLRKISFDKFLSQKINLKVFNLDYLIEDIENEFETKHSLQKNSERGQFLIDISRDHIIQEEIFRLINDMSFQFLMAKEEAGATVSAYQKKREMVSRKLLKEAFGKYISQEQRAISSSRNELAVNLHKEILRRRDLVEQIHKLEKNTPLVFQNLEEFKENNDSIICMHSNLETSGMLSHIPKDDKLYKYCKLISLSCGMSFAEVEQSIDLIEQSLLRTKR